MGAGLQGVGKTERGLWVAATETVEVFGGRNGFRFCDLAPTSWKITGLF